MNRKISHDKSVELKLVTDFLVRTKLSKNEQWMFDNYWNDPEYKFGKDGRGKLCVHKIDRS